MSDFFRTDLKVAARQLWRRPGFTLLAILTLALGIGANTAIFSVVHGALMAPLPYPEADRLLQVWNKYPLMDLPVATVSIPDYFDRRSGVSAFEESALYTFTSLDLADSGAPERVIGVRTTASLFPLLRTRPLHGRVFEADTEIPGADRVVLLSEELFERRFGGDRSLIGQDLRIAGEPYRVLGVLPADFDFPLARVDLWMPYAFTEEEKSDDSRGNESSFMIARLADGASAERAQQEIDAIHAANLDRFPEAREFWINSGFGGFVRPMREQLYGELRPTLVLLQAVVAFVLLIACANVANLLLGRLQARRKELALRASLGASRWQMARQLLAESLLLASVGGLTGVWLAWGAMRVLEASERTPWPDTVTVGLVPGVLLFAFGLALTTALLVTLLPVVTLRQTRPGEVLKQGAGRGGSEGRAATLPRRALVVAEVAISLLLLVGAGLMVRTLANLTGEDPGFTSQGIVTARVSLPEARYADQAARSRFFDESLERIRALPGVENAALISQAPFSGSSSSGSYRIEGYEPGPGESAPHALRRVVDAEYFRTLGIELLAGRGFERSDHDEAPPVVVVDRRVVEKYFPEGDALGSAVLLGDPDDGGFRAEIVGVVEPIKTRSLDQVVTKETLYFHVGQFADSSMTYVLSTSGPAANLTEPLRRAILEIDAEQPIHSIRTLDEQVAESLRTRRLSMGFLVGFGALAVVLAAIGLYGVLAFSTAQRTREIGTRVALGARPGQIVQLVLRQGLGLTGLGLGIGVVLALIAGRWLASRLYGVAPWDPATLVTVSAILLGVAVVACLRPALRALRVSPIEALREE